MSTAYILGFIVGVALVAVVCLILGFVFKKKRCNSENYDERQNLVRGKAYKIGFFTLLIYNGIYMMIAALWPNFFMEAPAAAFLGIVIAVAVFGSYCIWHDAYLGLSENPKQIFILFGVIMALNFVCGIHHITEGDVIVNGVLTFNSLNLLCGVLFLILFVVFGLKALKNRMEE